MQMQFTSGQDVNMVMEMEGLSSESSTEMNMKISMDFAFGKVTLQTMSSNGMTRYYVNGKAMSEKEVQDIFGDVAVKNSESADSLLETSLIQ